VISRTSSYNSYLQTEKTDRPHRGEPVLFRLHIHPSWIVILQRQMFPPRVNGTCFSQLISFNFVQWLSRSTQVAHQALSPTYTSVHADSQLEQSTIGRPIKTKNFKDKFKERCEVCLCCLCDAGGVEAAVRSSLYNHCCVVIERFTVFSVAYFHIMQSYTLCRTTPTDSRISDTLLTAAGIVKFLLGRSEPEAKQLDRSILEAPQATGDSCCSLRNQSK